MMETSEIKFNNNLLYWTIIYIERILSLPTEDAFEDLLS